MEGVAIIADSKGRGYNFARGVYEYVSAKEERDFSLKLVDIERTNFRDREFKIHISETLRRKQCYLIHDSNKQPSEWFTELNFLLEAVSSSSPSEINVLLPYTRFARQDRKDTSRVGVNAKALAHMISKYADRGMTVDLHNPAIQEFFDIPFDNLYSFPSLISHLERKHKKFLENLVVVSPDLGGGKRAEALFKRLNLRKIKSEIALGYKTREKDNNVEKIIVIGEVSGKNCLIIDDIIDTGKTMGKAAYVLKNKGAKKIYAYGTHGLFTDGTEKFKVFDKVLVSDTLYNNFNNKNFEIVSLISLFGEAVYRTIAGESLSNLFDDKK